MEKHEKLTLVVQPAHSEEEELRRRIMREEGQTVDQTKGEFKK